MFLVIHFWFQNPIKVSLAKHIKSVVQRSSGKAPKTATLPVEGCFLSWPAVSAAWGIQREKQMEFRQLKQLENSMELQI